MELIDKLEGIFRDSWEAVETPGCPRITTQFAKLEAGEQADIVARVCERAFDLNEVGFNFGYIHAERVKADAALFREA